MSAKVGYSTPVLHVAEIERSIRFYELLGLSRWTPTAGNRWDGRAFIVRAGR
jgi:hypothetical protein